MRERVSLENNVTAAIALLQFASKLHENSLHLRIYFKYLFNTFTLVVQFYKSFILKWIEEFNFCRTSLKWLFYPLNNVELKVFCCGVHQRKGNIFSFTKKCISFKLRNHKKILQYYQKKFLLKTYFIWFIFCCFFLKCTVSDYKKERLQEGLHWQEEKKKSNIKRMNRNFFSSRL